EPISPMATASTVMSTAVVASFLITNAFTYRGSLTGRTFLLVISTLATPARSWPAPARFAGCTRLLWTGSLGVTADPEGEGGLWVSFPDSLNPTSATTSSARLRRNMSNTSDVDERNDECRFRGVLAKVREKRLSFNPPPPTCRLAGEGGC